MPVSNERRTVVHLVDSPKVRYPRRIPIFRDKLMFAVAPVDEPPTAWQYTPTLSTRSDSTLL